MIYRNKTQCHVTLHRYLLSEEHFEISYRQRVNRHGEVKGTGYLVQRIPTRIYHRKGKPSGMARRILGYANAGMEKRNSAGKPKSFYTTKDNIIPK